jgi:DNA-binding MarR family transcriptional regulator
MTDAEKREKWMSFVRALNPEVDPGALRLMDELRAVSHALHQLGEQSVAVTGLSYARMRLLLGLMFAQEIEGREHGLNPSEISERQGTSRNTISSLIGDLEKEGLIQRTLDPDDRRRWNIQLTERGLDVVRTHVSHLLSTIASCFNVLDADEQKQLSGYLVRIGQAVDEARKGD